MELRNVSATRYKAVTSSILKLASTTNASSSPVNCSAIMRTTNQRLEDLLLALFVTTLVLGTIFNSLAAWVFCYKMKKWTESRVFMMNLLLSDCCLLFTLPFRIYANRRQWDLGFQFCNAILSFYFLNTYMGIAIITLIAVDRFVAIKFPLKARSFRSPKKAAIACAVVWVLFICTRVYLDALTDLRFRDHNLCFRKVNTKPLKRTLYFAVLGFCIPMIILVFCSTQIILILKRKNKLTDQEEKDIQKSIYIVSANLAIFLFCFLPLGVGNILRFVMESMELECSSLKAVSDFVNIAQGICNINCCLDSVCYYFVAKEFWEKASILPKSKKQLIQDQTQDSSI
ncbi:G-protein coupled receptor 35-like [Hyperolius riggenbachi]|uniref:G-protein coupled receptor 35-like n=1 Tax=Hyperolius riggenbachi TaxID=752182 RepID=UPI0035A2C14B